jgi:hypothetical protein
LGGTAGPLITLASVLLLFAAFLGQQHQLAIQEKQLVSQQRLMSSQTDVLRRQVFETSFFTFLRFQRDSALTLIARPSGLDAMPLSGLAAFAAASAEVVSRISTKLRETNETPSEADIAQLVEAVCLSPHSNFGHYFRTLYYLVQFTSERAGSDRHDYMKLVRAQLSNDELLLLFVNGLGLEGRKTFKSRIEEFGLLKGLRMPSAMEPLRRNYQPEAFSDG